MTNLIDYDIVDTINGIYFFYCRKQGGVRMDQLKAVSEKEKWTFNHQSCDYWGNDMFDSREEAIVEGVRHATEMGWTALFVGKVSEPSIGVCGDHAIDEVQEDVYDQCGEFAEGFLSGVSMDMRHELSDMLTDTFITWMKKNELQPTFFTITETEEIKFKNYVDITDLV